MSDIDEFKEVEALDHSAMSIPISERPGIVLSSNKEFKEISVGDPQKVRDGRDSYYIYPIYHKNQSISSHRYSDFVWLKERLSKEFPGCMTISLPEKEGLHAYWGSQDPMFHTFRRFGLEKFLQRISAHPRLSQSQAFLHFLKEEGMAFKNRMKESNSKGWMGSITEWSSNLTSMVSTYVYGEHIVLQQEADHSFNQHRNEIKNAYQQQTTLCQQGQEFVKNLEAEINSNLALSKAYENMGNVEREDLNVKLRVMADVHAQIANVQRDSFHKIKGLVGMEMEDYRRYCEGLLESIERRNTLRIEENQGRSRVDIFQVNQDLKQAVEDFHQDKKFLSQVVCNQIILYKQEVTEKISAIWKEAYDKVMIH